MKFSVLMSVYYKEKPEYFDKAIESILNQTVQPSEIVIVEDGPIGEELEQVIKKYTKKYKKLFKIYPQEKNMGLGIALNKGLEKCTYELVARMDTDDISLENRFEEELKMFQQDQDLDIVGALIQEYDSEMKKKESIRAVPETDDKIKKFLKNRNAMNHMTVMYKRSKVLNAGGYMDCPFFEDYYLWCRMANNKCKFYNIQKVLAHVRAGLSMIDRRGGLKYFKSIKNFYTNLLNIGFITKSEYRKNLMIRYSVAASPIFLRKMFYKTVLRKKSSEK